MAGVSKPEAQTRLNAEYGAGVATAYSSHKLHLYTADPGATGTASNEVTGGSYAAQTITFGAATAGTNKGATCANNVAITFSVLPATTVSFIGIDGTTAAAVTNLQITSATSASYSIPAGASLVFAVGAITVGHDLG